MKKVCDFLKNFLIIAYIVLIIFVTICLLSYNDYKMTVFGKNTLVPIIDEDLEPDYTLGDLLIIKKNKFSQVDIGDVIFFYRTVSGETSINYAKVIATERVTDNEFTYTVEGNYRFSSERFIGKAETATVIPKIGKFLSVLQSKWGFLFLGVFPSLIAFLYTLYSVVVEVRDDDDDEVVVKKTKGKKKTVKKEEKIENEVKENIKTESENIISEKNEIKKEQETEKKDSDKEKTQSEEKESIKAEGKKEETKVENVVQNEEKKTEKVEDRKLTDEQKKKALIEAKMKSMTEEEKKALIQAKLNSMTEEEKRALIEAKRKKMEAEKNKK